MKIKKSTEQNEKTKRTEARHLGRSMYFYCHAFDRLGSMAFQTLSTLLFFMH